MTLIDGKALAETVRDRVAKQVETLARPPRLVVILVGDNPASQAYVRNKEKMAAKAGFKGEIVRLPADTPEDVVFGKIAELNADDTCDGILVQLPLPKHLPEDRLIDAVDPNKDPDGFHLINAGHFYLGQHFIRPCTPAGVMEMIQHYHIPTQGKRAVVIGRSNIVGKPMAKLLMDAHATVTIAHSRTQDLPGLCREADIVVAAVGRVNTVTQEMVKPGAAVFDVGMNRIQREGSDKPKLVGDVDFEGVSKVAGFLTPVPGGVGPMTVAMLLVNTLELAKRRQQAQS